MWLRICGNANRVFTRYVPIAVAPVIDEKSMSMHVPASNMLHILLILNSRSRLDLWITSFKQEAQKPQRDCATRYVS